MRFQEHASNGVRDKKRRSNGELGKKRKVAALGVLALDEMAKRCSIEV